MRTLPTLLVFGISAFASLLAQVDCSRTFDGLLPFIGDSESSFHLTPKYQNENWIGVECRHENEKSPHLVGTHIESGRHVFGDHKTLKQVIEMNLDYLNEIKGVHIRVAPTLEAVVQVIDLGDNQKTILYENGDTYTLAGSFDPQGLEHIISLQTVESAFAHSIISDETILFLQIENGEKMIKNWPYLTNEAMTFLEEKGFRIIALNIPSIDREVDGGRTSNHKIFFKNENNLIVESANFSNVPLGNILVKLVLGNLDAFVDCASCEHLYAYKETAVTDSSGH